MVCSSRICIWLLIILSINLIHFLTGLNFQLNASTEYEGEQFYLKATRNTRLINIKKISSAMNSKIGIDYSKIRAEFYYLTSIFSDTEFAEDKEYLPQLICVRALLLGEFSIAYDALTAMSSQSRDQMVTSISSDFSDIDFIYSFYWLKSVGIINSVTPGHNAALNRSRLIGFESAQK